MLDFNQKRKLLELRDKYKYDIALSKQEDLSRDYEFESEEQELEILASLHMSRQLQEVVTEFIETLGDLDNLAQFVELGAICNEPIGKIASQLDKDYDKIKVDAALSAIDNIRNRWREDEPPQS